MATAKNPKIMELNGVIDPFSEEVQPRGRGVRCNKTTNNITFCWVDKEKSRKYWSSIIVTLLGLLALAVFFSIKVLIIPI